MFEPTYDIFRGAIGSGDERWLEAIPGLENARKRMEEIATAKPGLYFVFHVHSHSVVACADTRIAAPASNQERTKIA
jgi:hypothetical protein